MSLCQTLIPEKDLIKYAALTIMCLQMNVSRLHLYIALIVNPLIKIFSLYQFIYDRSKLLILSLSLSTVYH